MRIMFGLLLLLALVGCTVEQLQGAQEQVRHYGGLARPLADAAAPGAGAAVDLTIKVVTGILGLVAWWTAKTAHRRITKAKREMRNGGKDESGKRS